MSYAGDVLDGKETGRSACNFVANSRRILIIDLEEHETAVVRIEADKHVLSGILATNRIVSMTSSETDLTGFANTAGPDVRGK